MKKNAFLTFCFSLVPGAGQMYQGYMKRGFSILMLLVLLCMLSVIVNVSFMVFPIMALFAYSFFDTFNIRNRIGTSTEVVDEYIWKETEIENLFGKFNIQKRHIFLGYLLIIAGIYIFFTSVLSNIAYYYDIRFLAIFVRAITSYLPPLIIATICVYIGVKFITNKEK